MNFSCNRFILLFHQLILGLFVDRQPASHSTVKLWLLLLRVVGAILPGNVCMFLISEELLCYAICLVDCLCKIVTHAGQEVSGQMLVRWSSDSNVNRVYVCWPDCYANSNNSFLLAFPTNDVMTISKVKYMASSQCCSDLHGRLSCTKVHNPSFTPSRTITYDARCFGASFKLTKLHQSLHYPVWRDCERVQFYLKIILVILSCK